jgi:hypothetical protein
VSELTWPCPYFFVGAEGFEDASNTPEEKENAANRREEVPTPESVRGGSHDPEEAVRAAIKSAVDAGQYNLASKLLEVLKSTAAPSVVVEMAKRR